MFLKIPIRIFFISDKCKCKVFSFIFFLSISRLLVHKRMEEQCVFCKKALDNGEEIVVLREKGCESIDKARQILGSMLLHTLA